ncbi:phosphotransferase [Nesterenkonia flava]|uniref:Phosphotransferase n=1 Tax=Nesterenkonia flava TaxID=469799 RepID=A0ABU1FQC0_9MICC|nr:phosphotransferase [Nesterenkonia flava]MDR5710840.1 phosphotransferase [Nesterenkonia flava]
MRWTPTELAALATAAVPGLTPTGVAAAADDRRDFVSAVVEDSEGNRWRVRAPQHPESAMRLETELQVLRGFTSAVRAELPFRLPSVAGAVRRGEMRTFVYNHLPGASLPLNELITQPPAVIDDIGRTIAAIHDLDASVVDHADLPRYSAERLRQRRLNELDAAAATGLVPSMLLRRWEHAMEDKALWKFTPVVVHGDLHEDNLLISGDRVVATTGWTDLHIGDPAEDLAWLTASPLPQFATAVMAAYTEHRTGEVDEHLMRRAALAAEFALAQWLVRGKTEENPQMVEEAKALLAQLKTDIETFGGQEISVTPEEGEEVKAPAETQDSKPVARPGAHATVAGYGTWNPEDDGEPAVITDASAAEEDADDDATGTITPLRTPSAQGQNTTGQITRAQSSVPAQPAPGREDMDDDPPTDQIPAYVEDEDEQASDIRNPFGGAPTAADIDEDQTPTSSFTPVAVEPHPTTGSLPIQPDSVSEKRAKRKNFFPAKSASSARSAESAQSAESARSASSARSAASVGSAASAPSAASAEDLSSPAPKPQTTPRPVAASPKKAAEPAQKSVEAERPKSTGAEDTSSAGSSTRESIYSRHPGLRPPGA